MTQASAICPDVHPFFLANTSNSRTIRKLLSHMFLLEPRDGLSDVTLCEIARFGELAGEDPFAKWGVGDNLDSKLLGYRGGLSLDASHQ